VTGPETLTIRPAAVGDRAFALESCGRLARFGIPTGRTAAEIVEGEARTLRAYFDDPSAPETLLVAEADGRPVGFVFLEEKQDYFTQETHGHIGILVVAEAAEGRGVGAALMDAAERWARARAHTCLTLNVFDGNHRARRLYDRRGFAPDTIKYKKAL
jgi:GNAT superfamily N-acetyltransferase